MQAINIFGLKFTRSRVEEPVHDEIQSDSDAESRKRNSSEAALKTSERKPAKRYILNIATENNFFNA